MKTNELEFRKKVIADIKKRCGDLCEGFVFEYNEEGQLNFYVPARKTLTHSIMVNNAFEDDSYEFDMDSVIERFKWFKERQELTSKKNKL